jgi:hypothetical protein
VPDPSRFKDRDYSITLRKKEVMGEENRIKDLGQEGYRSLGKMIQGSVRCTVWAQSLSDLETHDGSLTL